MSNDVSKLRLQHEQAERTEFARQTERQQEVLEFAAAEDAIRADRDQTAVPPEIAERLNESIRQEPKPERTWWNKLFRRPSGQPLRRASHPTRRPLRFSKD